MSVCIGTTVSCNVLSIHVWYNSKCIYMILGNVLKMEFSPLNLMIRYYDYTRRKILFPKSVQKDLKLCFYVATASSSLCMPGWVPAEFSHSHSVECITIGPLLFDVIKGVFFNWAFWLRGLQLSGRNQKYTGRANLHIIKT